MISLALLVSLALVPTPRQFPVLGRGIPMATSGGSPGLLSSSNLTCTGVQLSYAAPGGSTTARYPMTVDPATGHFYEVSGAGHVIEQVPNTWSACSTALGSMTSMTLATGGDWGAITTGGTDNPFGSCANGPCYFNGISFTGGANHQAVISWASAYSSVPLNINVFALVHLAGGVVVTDGCYAVSGANGFQPMWGLGSMPIPTSFQTAYSANLSGSNYILSNGGYSASSEVSLGPSALAIVLPTTTNACNADFTSPVGTGIVMAQFSAASGNVPACDPSLLGTPPSQSMNCDYSAGTLKHPWPAFIANTSYRYNVYGNTWNPVPYASPTHGYSGLELPVMGWYDDGSSGAVGTMLAAYDSTECWNQTTVTGGVSGSYPTWNATIGSTSCHSAVLANLRAGDRIYLQTCVAGVDAGCSSDNAEDYSIVTLNSVNTSTGAIQYTLTGDSEDSGDSSTNCAGHGATCGQPISNAIVKAGAVYFHASTHKTRTIFHLQFIDASEYGKVLNGTYATPDLPTYTTDADLTAMGVLFRGANPTTGNADPLDSGGEFMPVSILPDPAHSLIYIVFRNGVGSPEQNVIYRFAVTH